MSQVSGYAYNGWSLAKPAYVNTSKWTEKDYLALALFFESEGEYDRAELFLNKAIYAESNK